MTVRIAPIFDIGSLAERRDPIQPGHFYYADDEDDGTLYASFDGVEWEQVGGSRKPRVMGGHTVLLAADESLIVAVGDPGSRELLFYVRGLDGLVAVSNHAGFVVGEGSDIAFGVDDQARIMLGGELLGTLRVDPANLPARPTTVAEAIAVLVRAGLCK